MQTNKVLILDLDGTLVSLNTTEDFIYFFLKRYHKLKLLLFVLFEFVIKNILIIVKLDVRKWQIRFLRGFPKNKLETAAQLYVEELISFINPTIQDFINNYQKKDYKIIILSASLDFIVNNLIKKLNFYDGRGGTLKFNESGICLGEFQEDLTSKKHLVLPQLISDIDYNNSLVLSDNKEDFCLLKLFSNSLAIIQNKAQKLFWSKYNIKTLYLAPYRPFNKYCIKYILPLGYFYISRSNSMFLLEFIINSTIIFHFITLLFFHLLNVSNILLYSISLLSFYSIYEIHYILNDCHALKEKDPSLRIDESACRYKYFLISIKLLFGIIFLYILRRMNINTTFLIISYIILSIIYFIHTYIANNLIKTFITYPLLLLSHLLIPLLIYSIPFKFILITFIIYGYYKALSISYINKVNPLRRFWYTSVPLYIIFLLLISVYKLFLYHNTLLLYLIISGIYFITEEFIFNIRKININRIIK